MFTSPLTVLCFSGSDPSGGAGIQADITAIHALGAHCASIITALTIQNTQNVYGFIPIAADFLLRQADVIMQDLPIAAIKIGMLGSIENVLALGAWLQAHPHIPVVLDPVTVASGGGELGDKAIIEAITQHLLPRATLITPNTVEAQQFVPQAENLDECAQYFLEKHCDYVLIKGSHADTPDVTNTLYHAKNSPITQTWTRLPHDYHGSGCTLAASVAAFLARGCNVVDAVEKAQTYTWECLAQAYRPGKGQYVPQRILNKENS